MSRSRQPGFVRQSLVPLLGFFAMSLFVINFFTFLSHFSAPDRCSARMRTVQPEPPAMEWSTIHSRIEVERQQIARQLQQAEAQMRLECDRLKRMKQEMREHRAAMREAHRRARTERIAPVAFDVTTAGTLVIRYQ